MADTGTTGATGAAETPKNDFVLATENEQVKAVLDPQPAEKPKEEEAPKKAAEEAQDAEGEEASADESSDGDKKPKRTGYQRKLAKKDAQISALQAELNALKAPKPGETSEAPKKADVASTAPKLENFETYEEYDTARVNWLREQIKQEHAQEAEKKSKEEATKAQNAKLLEDLQAKGQRWEEGKAKIRETDPDFDRKLAEYDGPESPMIFQAILDSERSAEVTKFLIDNPEEADKMEGMGLVALNRFIGRIEAKLETSEGSKPQEKAAVKTTGAPPPIKPVGSGKGGVEKNPYEMNGDDYLAWEKAQRRKK